LLSNLTIDERVKLMKIIIENGKNNIKPNLKNIYEKLEHHIQYNSIKECRYSYFKNTNKFKEK